MNPQKDEIIRFLHIIQPIRVIDWADITIQKKSRAWKRKFWNSEYSYNPKHNKTISNENH